MREQTLHVLIAGTLAGYLHQDGHGVVSFAYDDAYQGPPLSLSMPVTNRIYRDAVVLPYLLGLLPDSERQRRAIARQYDVSAGNPVALLARIGLDCPGAVQVCPPELTDGALARAADYRELDEHEVAVRLKSIRDEEDSSWMGLEERWSLGGNQGKFALARKDGRWYECHGSAPTTHIFKNGIAGLRLEALNEFMCLRCAELCGIAAARVEYLSFEDEPALVVERFDRLRAANGAVARLHQEDLCQALSCPPERKYTADGGPAARDILELLATTRHASSNLLLFTQQLFFNCLIGAPDAHAKNYSLLLGADNNAILAPMYDVASGLAYERFRRRGRLAMSIGGENRVGRVGSGAVERYAGAHDLTLSKRLDACGITAKACVDLMADLAQRIPPALELAFSQCQGAPGSDELRERLLPAIAENCRITLALL